MKTKLSILSFAVLTLAGAIGVAYFETHKQFIGGCVKCPPSALCPDICFLASHKVSRWILIPAGLLTIGITGLLVTLLKLRPVKRRS